MNRDEARGAGLRQLQETELGLLKKFDALCREKRLRYYLAYGTLLGSVRHEGFIPWDDDLDVFMPREDHERLLALTAAEIPEGIRIRTYRTTPEDDPRIAFQTKVESADRAVVRTVGDRKTLQQVWMDVFVLDGMPGFAVARGLHYLRFQALHTLFRAARSARNGWLKDKKRGRLERAGLRLLKAVPAGRLFSVRKRMAAADRCLARIPFDRSGWVFGYAPEYGRKRLLRRAWFEGERAGTFEGMTCPVPKESEALLKRWYGDYGQLPPEEMRYTKHIEEIVESDGL